MVCNLFYRCPNGRQSPLSLCRSVYPQIHQTSTCVSLSLSPWSKSQSGPTSGYLCSVIQLTYDHFYTDVHLNDCKCAEVHPSWQEIERCTILVRTVNFRDRSEGTEPIVLSGSKLVFRLHCTSSQMTLIQGLQLVT